MYLHYITTAKSLTPKEKEVAKLLVTSMDAKDMALVLSSTPRTIKAHCASIYIKTNCTNRIEYMAQTIQRITNAKP